MTVSKLIKTAADYQAVMARIEAIFEARPGTPQGDELDLLVTLVEVYENKAFPIDLPGPIAAIRFRMEQDGLKAKDLVPYIGSASKVSEVLAGKRSLSLAMIRKVRDGLGIPAEVLLREPGMKRQGRHRNAFRGNGMRKPIVRDRRSLRIQGGRPRARLKLSRNASSVES